MSARAMSHFDMRERGWIKQTSLHIERMGPFFIGKAVWQNLGAA